MQFCVCIVHAALVRFASGVSRFPLDLENSNDLHLLCSQLSMVMRQEKWRSSHKESSFQILPTQSCFYR